MFLKNPEFCQRPEYLRRFPAVLNEPRIRALVFRVADSQFESQIIEGLVAAAGLGVQQGGQVRNWSFAMVKSVGRMPLHSTSMAVLQRRAGMVQ